MKKKYVAPLLEIERYELSTSITQNCSTIVHNGPAIGAHAKCDDYDDPFTAYSLRNEVDAQAYNVNFYEDTDCTCYTTAGSEGYWMS